MAKLGAALRIIAVSALVVLAASVVYIAYGLYHRQFVEDRQREIGGLITDLAYSREESKLIAAISVAEAALLKERIPIDVYLQVITRANASEHETVRDTARASIASVMRASSPDGRDLVRALNKLPGRVLIHVRHDADHDKLEKLKDELRREPSLMVQGAFFVDQKTVEAGPTAAEVRCFSKADCEAIPDRLVDFLKAFAIAAEKKDLSPQYEKVLFMKNNFEIWLPPGALKHQTSADVKATPGPTKKKR